MARSLARNTRLVISELAPADLSVNNANLINTYELKVLDGYSYSQDVTTQEIGINEAGSAPVRGTLGFNTALNPVDVSFSTYVRAYDDAGTGNCVEKPMWGSAMGSKAGWTASGNAVAANVGTYSTSNTDITFSLGTSNTNELQPFYLYFILENTTFVVEDFNVSGSEVDFSIDGIATINWSGFGSRVNEDPVSHAKFTDETDVANYLVVGTDYKGVPTTTTTTFLRNKLSTLQLKNNSLKLTPTISSQAINAINGQTLTINGTYSDAVMQSFVGGRILNDSVVANGTNVKYATIVAAAGGIGLDLNTVTVSIADNISTSTAPWVITNTVDLFEPSAHAGVVYSIPITGATLTLENNFTYLTPEELAIVNLPLAGFSGNRVISGSFTAYLNTGAQGSAGLLADLLKKIEEVSNDYELIFNMGGDATTTPRVDFTIAHAQIAIPTTSVEDIISTEISFTGKPWDTTLGVGSFEDTNELVVKYVP